jgi:hypothetical protein
MQTAIVDTDVYYENLLAPSQCGRMPLGQPLGAGLVIFFNSTPPCSDTMGGCTVVNDTRWAGAYGVNVDFVARTHCSVEVVTNEDIQVHLTASFCSLLYINLLFLFTTISRWFIMTIR